MTTEREKESAPVSARALLGFFFWYAVAVAGSVVIWLRDNLTTASGKDSPTTESHGGVTLGIALAQMTVAVAVCCLWFCGFRAARLSEVPPRNGKLPWRWVLSILHWILTRQWCLVGVMLVPAAAFALAMKDKYNPAVFVMALAAIFVAAEHYSSIAEARADLTKTRNQLDKTQAALEVTRKELEEALRRNQESIEVLLNADGLAKWRKDVYRAYAGSYWRIDAVIRIFDIDEAWWNSDGNWDRYEEHEQLSDPTLFFALTQSDKRAPRTDSVLFVAEMPSPPFEGSQILGFESFLGLTWWLLVVERVRRHRGRANVEPRQVAGRDRVLPFVHLRIASSQSWMHAIDDSVYQVIERPQLPASVRLLTATTMDEPRQRRLSRWAHDDIRRTGRRGCDGEEYVCSVIRYVALHYAGLNEDNPLRGGFIEEILNKIGMKEWIQQFNVEDRERRRKLAIAIVEEFINQRKRDSASAALVLDLLRDVA